MCAVLCALTGSLQAQQLIGYVPARDADVTGASEVMDGRAVLAGSASVSARDHTASISLGRGGTVRVCQTSVLHLSESREMMVAAPLLLSLDRGAIEIQTTTSPGDALMTPDLRFTVRSRNPLDLRLRMATNGDTCVENRGNDAPTLIVSDPFGEAMYQLTAGQHVLFEHGSLHEVVDRESSPCGCPEVSGISVAEALLAPGAVAQHPFPAAISEGLAPEADVPQAAPGAVHVQVSDSLSYNAQSQEQAADQGAQATASGASPSSAPARPGHASRLVHRVGHLFRQLFRRS
jgi:hypothetical protein